MNLDIYTSEMSKSVWDKAFFMDKIPGAKCVIDFGCADGAMIHFLAPLFPDITFVGYDISTELIDRARKTAPYKANTVFFDGHQIMGYRYLIQFIKDKKFKPEEICINFSSVLHEVFSSTTDGQRVIKRMVDELAPRYITIRDMYFHGENSILSYYYVREVLNGFSVDDEKIEEFEDEFGSICSKKNLHHFLMKYQWKDNGWDDEMAENYFSWNITDFMKLADSYTIAFNAFYMLPYYREQWFEHELYPLDADTHAQFILRRW